MKNKVLLIYLLLLALSFKTYSQGLGQLPSTPEASALGKYIDFPVSPFTGTHSLSLPLYEIKIGTFSWPLFLSYHSSGVKVQDVASRVGMGWAFQGEGTITCVVNGRADLGTDVIQETNGAFSSSLDDGKDLFYYSFGKYSGKFLIQTDPYGEVTEVFKLDSNHLKIEFREGDEKHISIVDEEGNQYAFYRKDYVTDKITYLQAPIEDLDHPRIETYTIGYITGWGLQSITLNTGETISFNYEAEFGTGINYDINRLQNFNDAILWPIGSQYPPGFGYQSARGISTTVLSSIVYKGTQISFSYNEPRQDLNGDKALTGIKVFSDGNVKNLKFSYSYRAAFNASSSPNTFVAKRLFLDNIQDASELSSPVSLYKFKYNETPLPHRLSFNMDMWGYYNQNGAIADIRPETFVYPRSIRHDERYLPFKRPSVEPVEIYIPGRKMQVDTNLVKAGILTSLTYANGGSTSFEYEPNEFLWFPETSANIQAAFNIKAGGVRIKRITHTDSTRSQIIKDFEYNLPFAPTKTSGGISNLPLFAYPGTAEDHKEAPSETVSFYSQVLIRSVRDLTVLGSNFNVTVGYRYVTVKTTNNGKSVYQFSFPGAYGEKHDNPAKGCSVDFQGFCDNLFKPTTVTHSWRSIFGVGQVNDLMGVALISDSSGTFPFAPTINYDWNRGLPIKELSYDTNNRLVEKKEYSYYTIKGRSIEELMVGSVCCGIDNGDGRLEKYGKYPVLTATAKKLKQQREVQYAGTDSIVTVKELSYDPQKLFIAKQKITTSKSLQKEIQYRYPHNFSPGNATYTEMMNRNIIAPIVEEKMLIENKLLKTITIDYDMNWFSDKRLIAPKNKWEQYGTGTPIKITEFKAYDSTGHPLTLTSIDGLHSYKWSKAGNLLAEVTNATSEESYYQGFEEYVGAAIDIEAANTGKAFFLGDFTVPYTVPNGRSYIIDYWYREQGKWKYIKKQYVNNLTLNEGDAIDDIRIIPTDAFIHTFSQDAIPLLRGTIDKYGNKTVYQYDNFWRLSLIRDRDGNITKSIRYSYAQNPDAETPTLFTNDEINRNIVKLNCGTGYHGLPVTYKVLKGKYKSSVSLLDANAKAQAEIDNVGQEYADLNGGCEEDCVGSNKKWINGVCEHGVFKFTRNVWVDDAYDCYYRFYFSDGTTSEEFLYGTYAEPCHN